MLGSLAVRSDSLAIIERFHLASRGEVGRNTWQGRMALGLDGQVADKLVAVLNAVLEEEAVTDGVVGHVVFDLQVIGAMHGRTTVEGIVDGRVSDVLAQRVADQMPVDR